MSPRLKIPRRIETLPPARAFAPIHSQAKGESAESILVFFEELEALRLCDYDGLTQQQAAEKMGISRPTFTRIYSKALRKIATAIVEGRPFEFVGGAGYFDSDWHHCSHCGCYFSNPFKPQTPTACPVCGSHQIPSLDENLNPEAETDFSGEFCPFCGHKHGPGRSRAGRKMKKCKNCGRLFNSISNQTNEEV